MTALTGDDDWCYLLMPAQSAEHLNVFLCESLKSDFMQKMCRWLIMLPLTEVSCDVTERGLR